MLVKVKVRPGAAAELVEKSEKGFDIWVQEPPKDNRANRRVIQLVAAHFKVPQKSVRIVSGHRTFGKILDVRQ